jgi:aspartyl-tRNA(Asn)/glutamyl-tRNA(Gln) amidotransferase subunit A
MLGKTLTELKTMLEKGETTAPDLKGYFLKRIEKYNKKLNAYLTVDTEREPKSSEGVLAGLPVAVKDNFCTRGLRTTASSNVLKNFIPPYESTVTKRLKKANAFVLGKTNMDAWAHGSSTETSDFGPTHNPWDLSRSPGGSSGGSSAAVSAYLAPAAIGSETPGPSGSLPHGPV